MLQKRHLLACPIKPPENGARLMGRLECPEKRRRRANVFRATRQFATNQLKFVDGKVEIRFRDGKIILTHKDGDVTVERR